MTPMVHIEPCQNTPSSLTPAFVKMTTKIHLFFISSKKPPNQSMKKKNIVIITIMISSTYYGLS